MIMNKHEVLVRYLNLSNNLAVPSLRFRTGVKDLEVMVQNIISSAFESLSRVEEGVEILDVFHHFSAREVSTVIKERFCRY